MSSNPFDPDPSLEALIATARPGEPMSTELLLHLQPSGVMGALAQMPLTEILQNMDFGKRSVRVDVWLEGIEGTVHVHDGQIVFARALTSAGSTEGETAVLDLCRQPIGFFRIQYVREEVDRNVHRPTTFVLLEALRVIDEARAHDGEASGATPAAVDLGPPLGHDDAPPPEPEDPWGDSRTEAFPPNVFEDEDRGNQMNDASAVVDIEIAAEMEEALAARAPEPRCASAFDNTSMSARDRLLGLVAESELLVAAGDLESAKRVLSKAQGLAPEDDDVRKKLLSVNEAIDAAQAYAFLERAMRGGPQAVELARRATQLRPARDVLLRSLAVFVRGGAHDEVADVAEQLLELDPDDEGALRTLLDANVAMQRWELAVSAGESLLRLRPDDEQLREKLAGVKARARRR